MDKEANTPKAPDPSDSSRVRQAVVGLVGAALIGLTLKASCKTGLDTQAEVPDEVGSVDHDEVQGTQREVTERLRRRTSPTVSVAEGGSTTEPEDREEARCLETDGSLPNFAHDFKNDEEREAARRAFYDCVDGLSPEAHRRVVAMSRGRFEAILSTLETMDLEQKQTIPQMTDELQELLEAKGCKFDLVFRSLGGLNGKDPAGSYLSVQVLAEVSQEGYTSFTAHIVWEGISLDVAGDTEEELFSQIFQALRLP